MADIDMDPDPVRQAGDDLQVLADHAKERLARALSTSETAADQHEGWSAGDALRECAGAWRQELDSLIAEVRDVGGRVAAAAAHRTQADAEAAERIKQTLTELSQ